MPLERGMRMSRSRRLRGRIFLLAVVGWALMIPSHALHPRAINLAIQAARWDLRPGLSTEIWGYNGRVPGTAIIVDKGERVVIEGINHLPVSTNIHWHGLEVPNDQDGPGKSLKPGEAFRYEFTVRETGTYWYHSHQSPVLGQLDRGLYGPFIVKAPEDDLYNGDHIFVLDDWFLDAEGRRLEGTARGEMERLGNIETVNGKTRDAIAPLVFQQGELHKLRFINASTAAVHTLKIDGHLFRVTHTDGHPLVQPFETDTISLSPGERIDVEVSAEGHEGRTYEIASGRPELGMRIPIEYRTGSRAQVPSPFVPAESKAFADVYEKEPDYVLELNSVMPMGMGGATTRETDRDHMGMDVGNENAMTGTGMTMAPMMRWTINGKSYPNIDPLDVSLGKIVKIRLKNIDTRNIHPMDHPMHVHGAYFQVVSLNGQKTERELWKDTVNVPAGKYVDIAFVMSFPGNWMLHCHIIDHEDNGMMTVVRAR